MICPTSPTDNTAERPCSDYENVLVYLERESCTPCARLQPPAMAPRWLSALRRLVMKRKGLRGRVEHHSFSSDDEDENLDPNALRPSVIEKHTHVDRVCRRDRTSTHTSRYDIPASPQKKRRASSVPPSFASRPSELPSLFNPSSEPVDIEYLLSQLDDSEKEPRKRTAGVRSFAHTHRDTFSNEHCNRIDRSFSGFVRPVHT